MAEINHMKWCLEHEIKIWAITEFEYQESLLRQKLNSSEINSILFNARRTQLLDELQKANKLRIVVSRNGKVEPGKMIFTNETVNEHILSLYKSIYEKENKF